MWRKWFTRAWCVVVKGGHEMYLVNGALECLICKTRSPGFGDDIPEPWDEVFAESKEK